MRFYRALLRLYPASFRREYGDELCAVFAARVRDLSGPFAPVARLLLAIADVVPNALAVHGDVLRQDLGFTARTLRRAPGFAATTVLVIALGIGANTAAFSLADYVLLRPLPFARPDRLVAVWERTPGYGELELSPANFRDWKSMSRSFSAMAAYNGTTVNLVGAGAPRRLDIARVTADLLPTLGVRPIFGRGFTAGDSAGAEAILGYAFWQAQFGGDPGVLGRTVRLDGVPHVVVGVMPASFRFPDPGTQLWTPLAFREDDYEDRNNTYLRAVGRLRDGVSAERAQADLAVVAARLERQYPKENHETGARVVRLRDEMPGRARLLVLALCGAALCTLLLACANVASLLLARAVSREREVAVRAALGAGRERLVRQLVTESCVLALVGGMVGVAVAAAVVPLLGRLVPATLPLAGAPAVDLRILAFAAVLVTLTGVGFGLVPALRVRRADGLAVLRDGARAGGGRQRLRGALVAIEVAASVVLLASSGLLLRAMWRLRAVDPGFRAEHVLAVRTALPSPRYDDVPQRLRFYDRVLSEVRALPGVEAAAYVTGLPMDMRGGIWPVANTGQEVLGDAENAASLRFVTPGYLAALRIPLVRGRDVADADTRDRPYVAVVSESFARRYWPGQDPIGRRFGFALAERTVVGVAGDVRVRGLETASEPQVYVPAGQVDDASMPFYRPKELVVRASAPAAALVPAIRRIVAAVDPEQPVSDVRTLDAVVSEQTASRSAQLLVLGILAAVALLLAAVGIHGLLAYAVSSRARELGVRRALGARPGELVRMVLGQGLRLSLLGILPGLWLAWLAGRAMRALLVGVAPGDPVTLALVVAACLAAALAGCVPPALRAARSDPMEALRAE